MAEEVQIKGSSDSYDNTLKKIIELNQKLNNELKKSKEYLESTNTVYKQLSAETQSFASSLGQVVGVTTQSSKTAQGSIKQVQKQVDNLRGKTNTEGFKAIQGSIKNIAGLLRGNSNFASILTSSLKTTITQSTALQSSLSTTSASMGAAGAAGASASAGVAAVGGTAVAAGAAVLGLVTAIAALIAMMYKLGEGGYKYELTVVNSQKVLGSSYKTAYEWANKMNDELGIAQDRTMALISSTAQLGRSSGMSTSSAGNLGIGANRLSTQISNATGMSIEDIQGQVNSALGGSNSLGAYGIYMDDNAAKAWLLRNKGIDAFNGRVSESTMIYARWMLIQEQAARLNYENAESSNSLAAMQLKLKNTLDSLSKHAQAIFIPVFQAVTEILLAIAEATLWVVNGFRQLIGLDKISLEVDGPSQESVDAAAELYGNYKKMGDELDALKQQLYGFDEVITQNPYDSTIADIGLGEAGLLDVIDENGAVKEGKSYGEGFVEGFKNVLGRMGKVGQVVGDFFNIDQQDYEDMNEIQQWLNQPGRKFIELVKKGDADGWDFLTAVGLESLHHFPIVAEIEALVNGDSKGFVKALIQDGLLFNPATWPIAMVWKGFDILSAFKDENEDWDVLIKFLHLEELKAAFTDACNYLYNQLSGFGTWLAGKIREGLNAINPVNVAGDIANYISSARGGTTQSKYGGSFLSRLLPTSTSGEDINYAKGGLIKAAHIARVDPNEVALPLTPSILAGIGQKIVDSTSGMGAGGGNITVNVHLGENGAIIADNYSLQKFSKKIGENVANQLKSTGQLAYGRKY